MLINFYKLLSSSLSLSTEVVSRRFQSVRAPVTRTTSPSLPTPINQTAPFNLVALTRNNNRDRVWTLGTHCTLFICTDLSVGAVQLVAHPVALTAETRSLSVWVVALSTESTGSLGLNSSPACCATDLRLDPLIPSCSLDLLVTISYL